MTENTSGHTDDLVVVWQRGDGPGRVEFVVTSSQAGELLALLAEEGVPASPEPRLVRGLSSDLLTIVAVLVTSPAACTAAGLAVRKFFDRHKGKRIRVGETGLDEAENYSARDIARIVRALSASEQGEQGDLGEQGDQGEHR